MIKKILVASVFALTFTACDGGEDSITNALANEIVEGVTGNEVCRVDASVVLGESEKTCIYDGHTLECSLAGEATLDGVLKSSSGLITLNNTQYTCP